MASGHGRGLLAEELRHALGAYRAAERRRGAGPRQAAALGTAVAGPRAEAAPPAVASATGKRRILCLHGYVQNGDIFRQKTGSVRKVMKGCEFEFVDAPHSALGAFPENGAGDFDAAGVSSDGVGPRGWWHAGENAARAAGEAWVRPASAYICAGWEESLAHLRREVVARGAFDGVFAFSQGCAVATALLREAQEGRFQPLHGVRFAVLVGGFLPRDTAVAAELRGEGAPLRVGSLHVTGTEDTLVARPRSEELAELYDPGRLAWFEHAGRHVVPTGSGAFRDALRQLLVGEA